MGLSRDVGLCPGISWEKTEQLGPAQHCMPMCPHTEILFSPLDGGGAGQEVGRLKAAFAFARTGFERGESILSRGRQRSRSEDSPRGSRRTSPRLQLRPVATKSAEPKTGLFTSATATPTASSFSSSPEHFGRTILLGPEHEIPTCAPVANPFASGGSPPGKSESLYRTRWPVGGPLR